MTAVCDVAFVASLLA